MAVKKVGELIKEARTKAGLSQTALAAQVEGVTAADIGKAERGEKDLSTEALRAIAKATGVTQKSLVEAPKNVSASAAKKPAASTAARKTTSTAAKKPASTTAKKPASTAAKKPASTAAKKPASTAAKKTAAAELTSAEKTMLNAWRKADAETQKAALSLLKGENEVIVSMLMKKLTGGGGNAGLSGLMNMLGGLGKK